MTGSKVDMSYYKDTKIWTLYDERIDVTDDNDHLGLIVSGLDEEQKNVDKNMQSCRKSLFALLGPAFAYKCKVAPAVQIHLWRVYCQPVLRSGLSALPIRPTHMEPIENTIFLIPSAYWRVHFGQSPNGKVSPQPEFKHSMRKNYVKKLRTTQKCYS